MAAWPFCLEHYPYGLRTDEWGNWSMKYISTTLISIAVCCYLSVSYAAVSLSDNPHLAGKIDKQFTANEKIAQAATWHLCKDRVANASFIVPQAEASDPRYTCGNMFFSLSRAIGMACFHISNGTGFWPQIGTSYMGIVIVCS